MKRQNDHYHSCLSVTTPKTQKSPPLQNTPIKETPVEERSPQRLLASFTISTAASSVSFMVTDVWADVTPTAGRCQRSQWLCAMSESQQAARFVPYTVNTHTHTHTPEGTTLKNTQRQTHTWSPVSKTGFQLPQRGRLIDNGLCSSSSPRSLKRKKKRIKGGPQGAGRPINPWKLFIRETKQTV